MSRTFLLLVVALVLGVSGVALYDRIREQGIEGVLQSLDFRSGGPQSAANALMSASKELTRAHQTNGSYAAADLSGFPGVELVTVNDTGYCLQVEKAGKWYHLLGPGGTTSDGAC